jgi:hypothetical protein
MVGHDVLLLGAGLDATASAGSPPLVGKRQNRRPAPTEQGTAPPGLQAREGGAGLRRAGLAERRGCPIGAAGGTGHPRGACVRRGEEAPHDDRVLHDGDDPQPAPTAGTGEDTQGEHAVHQRRPGPRAPGADRAGPGIGRGHGGAGGRTAVAHARRAPARTRIQDAVIHGGGTSPPSSIATGSAASAINVRSRIRDLPDPWLSAGRYFASGSGRSWKCTARGLEPLPRSISHGARSPLDAHNPRPFQPALGSSMRPSNPLA